jgi:polyketide biosynthesis enoyl-CoA hydratase PksI
MNDVISISYATPAIAVLTMADRESRNTFSHALLNGLIAAFEAIAQRDDLKVVVIQGYDNYFCCGGTQSELMRIYDGELDFTELAFYRLLLDCKIPTIAAMQGHALGGGLAFGCYADLMVLSEESLYSTNFMKYGFTPGMGATYIIPQKFGKLLGEEMLYSAKSYHGGTLRSRGLSASVVKKQDVFATAIQLAKELADKPRLSLTTLKQHLTQKIKAELPAIIEQELAMHHITFAQPEVKQRIENSLSWNVTI